VGLMSGREWRDRLRRRARKAGVELSSDLADRLALYYDLLSKWNAKINLTAFRLDSSGDDEAIDRLLIEPLAASRHVPPDANTLIDIGSGGGSPAIPLSLAAPRLRPRLVESKTRKAVFLREALRTLDLAWAEVETSRFEELLARPELHEAFDIATIRAVRIEPRTLHSLQAFLKPGGHLWLFRGPGGVDPEDTEIMPLQWEATYPLVPALRSRLVVYRKASLGRR
jgi:16S rRNA (guanine527-N7)-methyltransferase